MILFSIGKSAVTGWAGGGPGLSPALVARIRIPTTAESVFDTVVGLLYADCLGVPLPSGDFAALARDAASAASVLSEFLRRGGGDE